MTWGGEGASILRKKTKETRPWKRGKGGVTSGGHTKTRGCLKTVAQVICCRFMGKNSAGERKKGLTGVNLFSGEGGEHLRGGFGEERGGKLGGYALELSLQENGIDEEWMDRFGFGKRKKRLLRGCGRKSPGARGIQRALRTCQK